MLLMIYLRRNAFYMIHIPDMIKFGFLVAWSYDDLRTSSYRIKHSLDNLRRVVMLRKMRQEQMGHEQWPVGCEQLHSLFIGQMACVTAYPVL